MQLDFRFPESNKPKIKYSLPELSEEAELVLKEMGLTKEEVFLPHEED